MNTSPSAQLGTLHVPSSTVLSGRPRATPLEDAITIVFGLWMLAGLFTDGFAHSNLRDSIESFFTPWHAILYSGFASAALWTTWLGFKQARLGRRGLEAIPVGYELGIVGVIVFGLGGFGDMIWHTIFGIEVNIAALLSPSHLMLLIGGVLVVTSPLRSAWSRLPHAPKFLEFLPALVSSMSALATVAFFNMHLWGLGRLPDAKEWMYFVNNDVLISVLAGTLFTNAILMSAVLLLVRRWVTPFGSFTIMLGATALGMGLLRGRVDSAFGAALLTGLILDGLVQWLRPSAARVWQLRSFAALAPLTIWGIHYLRTAFFRGGINLEVEFWTGLLVMTMLSGLALSVLVVPPSVPAHLEPRVEPAGD
jgi:hypothetical protein